jgi:outer membrane protein TolC
MKIPDIVVRIMALGICSGVFAQTPEQLVPGPAAPQAQNTVSSAPVTLTLRDALERAQRNDPLYLSTVNDARSAHEDRLQARAALLPSDALRSEFLNTQGNGVLPGGRYVTNDGVHVYREWSVVHQDLSPNTLLRTGYKRTAVAEALAQAKAEITRRGLSLTVTRAFYALIAAQRKYATAQEALNQSNRFLTISQDLERGGEVAHSDVVKSQLQQTSQGQAFREATLAIETARLDLAVLIFRDFNENFTVVDDLNSTPPVPPFEEIQTLAERQNPDLRAAASAVRAAQYDISIARQAYLPSLSVDVDYGLEANAIALHSRLPGEPGLGAPATLGYFLTATLTVPVWDWGARKSRVRQAEIKHEQTEVELSAAGRQLMHNLHAVYEEAQAARDQVESLRRGADFATESLRLNTLRYQAGEATVLELVDAQNALLQARNSLDDGEVRFKLALAALQALTGTF